MIVLLGLHAVIGFAVIAFGARLHRKVLLIAAIPSAVTLVWLVLNFDAVVDGGVRTDSIAWAPSLGLTVDLRFDAFAALMVVLVAGIGVAVFTYSLRYFSDSTPTLARIAGLLTLFAGSMLGLVLADNLLVLFTFWELTSITSYLLIGNDHTKPLARAAALHALLVTGAGGLVMLAGFVVLGQTAGTYRLHEILELAPSGTAVDVALLLILVGVATKSAQYPFHGWLPGAMVAPTPVSAYLHSATMVKAGIYLLARLGPVFAVLGFWRPLLLGVGLLTMVGGGIRALRQTDLKLLLAFGTVSQLGLMTVLFGLGTPEAVTAGCVLLLAHGFFKAALFMVVGILDHQTGTRDIDQLPPLDRRWRPALLVTIVSAASMAGLPLLFGFIAKEGAYQAVLDAGIGGDVVVLAALTAGSAITVAYSIRFVWGAFYANRQRAPATAAVDPSPPARQFLLPAGVLALATLAFGFVPGVLDSFVSAADDALLAPESVDLAVWHGVNTALVLSMIAIAAGLALFAGRRRLARLWLLGDRLPDSGDAYLASLRALNVTANRTTGVVQNGSLPIYTAVVLVTAVALPVSALLSGGAWRGLPDGGYEPGPVLVTVVIVGAAIAAAVQRRRLAAVLLLGVTGYGMSALFLLRGAPDLALTQVTIETLSTVMFVLVLRKLPDRFERRSLASLRVLRVGIAAFVAAGVFVFALVVGSNDIGGGVADEVVARAYTDGHGRNVVNVILVDFRALDTAGEITVLAAAAIGSVALARAGRRPSRRPVPPFVDAPAGDAPVGDAVEERA
jgi:multicomponent Na+:H+ antiporter subunit A